MMQYFGIDWLAMCLTFAAIYLLGNKSRWGFVVMMTGNLSWSAIGLWAHSYAMVLANLGFFSMNVRGFVNWAPPRIVEPEIAQAAAPRSEPP
jgi:Nicotinamide mononucleotide transporter